MDTSEEFTSSSPLPNGLSSPFRPATDDSLTPPSSPTVNASSENNTSIETKSPIRTNAFSMLGKRKRPLSDGDINARPAIVKKPVTQNGRTKSSDSSQLQLSFGQKTEKKCAECNMVYVVCSAEDRKIHDSFHGRMVRGYYVGPQLASRADILPCGRGEHVRLVTSDRIHVITARAPKWQRRHARELLDIINISLGAVGIPDEELWNIPDDQTSERPTTGGYEMWMYLRGETCTAAMLIEKGVRKVRKVLKPDKKPKEASGRESAIEKLRRKREEAVLDQDAPLRVSHPEFTAKVGISRIWTAPAFRQRGYALSLLDAMVAQQIGWPAPIEEVAFSQPTTAGTRLARRWFGKQHGWLVY